MQIISTALRKMQSFLEESPGVMSSTRLIGVGLMGCAVVITVTVREYVLRVQDPNAAVVASLASVITALLGGSAWAIFKRGSGDG